jgi:hypothetical protein
MDKAREFRREDTYEIELRRVIAWLIKNGFELEGTREAAYYEPSHAICEFNKEIDYTDKLGNVRNDAYMKVSIQFQKTADYKHLIENEDQEIVSTQEPDIYISKLVTKIEQKHRANRTRKSRKAVSL